MSSDTPDGRSGPTGSNPPRRRAKKRNGGDIAACVGSCRRCSHSPWRCCLPAALYAVFAPQAQTAHAQEDPALVRQGEQLYNNACISCHGVNLQGVQRLAGRA